MQFKFSGLPWLPFLVYAPYPKIIRKLHYALASTRKRQAALERLLQTLDLQYVSDGVHGVSKLGRMDLMFIDVKINGTYYHEVLVTQKLLPIMREICGEFLVLQQGNVPAHRACEIIKF